MPVRVDQEALGRSSPPEARRRDAAFMSECETLVSFARLMLQPPGDLLDSPMIRQRRQEAALAALDALWASLATYNVANGDAPPTPATSALRAVPQRRTRHLGN